MKTVALGFNGSKKETIKIWKRNAKKWPSIGPPGRPSEDDIAIYKKLGGNLFKKRVLVLGATPEIRDLIASFRPKRNPVIVDISREMIFAMTDLLRTADPDREVWKRADWTKIPLPSRGFDIIIGDMIWWVLSIKDQPLVIKEICRLLSKNGIFLSRFRIANTKKKNIESVMRFYAKRLKHNHKKKEYTRGEMLSEIYDQTANIRSKRLNRHKVATILKKIALKTSDTYLKTFFQESIKRMIGSDWTVQSKKEIFDVLKTSFKIRAIQRAKDYNSEGYPILLLEPKRKR